MEVRKLQRNVSFKLNVDACEMRVSAKIEEMTIIESLFNFTFNVEHTMDLLGLVKLK